MGLITQTLVDPASYRRMVYLVSALLLGPIWFIALVTVWSLCLGLAITPFVIPVLIVLAFMTRGFAAVEAELVRALLDVDADAPGGVRSRPGFWGWFRGLFTGGFWRAQAYLMIRWFAGFPVALLVVTVLATGLGLLFAPAWVPFVDGGARLGFWRPHTLLQSLALVPAGVLLLPVGVLIAKPLALLFEPIAAGLLGGEPKPLTPGEPGLAARSAYPHRSRLALEAHAAVDAIVVFTLVVI